MGVHRAVEIALDVVKKHNRPIYTFGPLIHNPQVLETLKDKGVRILNDPAKAAPGSVVIRAHGVPPETKKRLADAGLTVIDATCPRVIKVQNIIAKYAEQSHAVIIVGDRDHPEVVGLLGFAKGNGHIIKNPCDVEKLPAFEKVIVVAQTTQDSVRFETVTRAVAERFPNCKSFNTICDSTHKRQAEIRDIARNVDAVVVVGGRDSANTQRLVQIAQQEGIRAFHIENALDIVGKDMKNVQSVGLTAGASTPNWVIKRVYRTLENLPHQEGGWRQGLYRVQRWLLLSNIYVAIGAGCLSYTCALLSGIPPNLPSALMATCYVLSMHILNNFIGKEAVRYNDPDRAQFYENHKDFLVTLAIVSGAVGLFMALSLGPAPFAVLSVISILGLLYNVRLFPGGLKIGRKIETISDVPGSKTILIAVAWGIVTVALPHLAITLEITTTMVFVSLLASVLVFVRTAFFDILDMQGDRLVGQESLPIVIGKDSTLRLLKQLLVLSLAILLFAPIMKLTTTLAHGIILSVLYMAWVVQAFEKDWIVPGFRFEFIVETIFLFSAGVSLVWHVFFLTPVIG
jgi:(E)-4-hydroxy-3-methyl-but-2-enyl pyrophosphate reductase